MKENEKFQTFTDELLKWNKVHKFTNYKTKEEIFAQIEDSLYPLEKIKDAKTAIDIGTGAGFPGLILAIAMPYTLWYLVEPLKKIGLFFWKKGDMNTIDRYGPDGLSRLVKIISDKAVHFQSGYLYHYAFVMLIGFSILLTYLILY